MYIRNLINALLSSPCLYWVVNAHPALISVPKDLSNYINDLNKFHTVSSPGQTGDYPSMVSHADLAKRAPKGHKKKNGSKAKPQKDSSSSPGSNNSPSSSKEQSPSPGSHKKPYNSKEQSPSPDSPEKNPVSTRPTRAGTRKGPKKPKEKKVPEKKVPKGAIGLGSCGTNEPGKILWAPPASSRSSSPGGRNKSPSPSLPPTDKARNVSQRSSLSKRGKKTGHTVCGVKLDFPQYPSSGDVIIKDPKTYSSIVEAFNAIDIDPCNDSYEVGPKPFPKTREDGVHGFIGRGRSHDIWNTEHVMDAQILKTFFYKTVVPKDGIPAKQLPSRFRADSRGRHQYKQNPNACDMLKQFWEKRWDAETPNAMKYLMEVIPGNGEFIDEFVLLPGRINNKKQVLFSEKKKDVIDKARWRNLGLHAQIDELRELVLLAEVCDSIDLIQVLMTRQYFNNDKIAASFQRLSNDITQRLAEIEDGKDARIRETDDFWWNIAGKPMNTDLKDKSNEKYRSFELSTKWENFIYNLVKSRLLSMYELQVELYQELEQTYAKIQKWPDYKEKVTKAEKAELKHRMQILGKHIKTKVSVQKLVSKPTTS